MIIREDDLTDHQIVALLGEHLEHMHSMTRMSRSGRRGMTMYCSVAAH